MGLWGHPCFTGGVPQFCPVLLGVVLSERRWLAVRSIPTQLPAKRLDAICRGIENSSMNGFPASQGSGSAKKHHLPT
jgi:hypothetical protein